MAPPAPAPPRPVLRRLVATLHVEALQALVLALGLDVGPEIGQGAIHLAGNVLALWVVGRWLEALIGSRRWLMIYAAAGIGGFKKMMSFYEKAVPLGRGVTIEEVGNAGAFLCSDLASGITGEVLYVDAGFNMVGMSERFLEQ